MPDRLERALRALAAPVRTGAGIAHLLRTRRAPRALPALRLGESGACASGGRQEVDGQGPRLVPRPLGASAAVVEGDRSGLRGELGAGPPGGRHGGGVGPGMCVAARSCEDRSGRDRGVARAALPDPGIPSGPGLPATAVGQAGPQDRNLGELLRVVRKGACGAAAGGLLGRVAGLPAGGAGAAEPSAAFDGLISRSATPRQDDRCGVGAVADAPGAEAFPLAAAEAGGATDRGAEAQASEAAQAQPPRRPGLLLRPSGGHQQQGKTRPQKGLRTPVF